MIYTSEPSKLSGRYREINLEQVAESQGSDNAANKREKQENAVATSTWDILPAWVWDRDWETWDHQHTPSSKYEIPRPRPVDYTESYVWYEIKELHYNAIHTDTSTHANAFSCYSR